MDLDTDHHIGIDEDEYDAKVCMPFHGLTEFAKISAVLVVP